MDNINTIGASLSLKAACVNNSRQRSDISFGSNSLNNDSFEFQNKKPEKSLFENIIRGLQALASILCPQEMQTKPEEVSINTEETTVETITPALNFNTFDDIEGNKELPNTEIARLLKSGDYEAKIKKASAGKYQKELTEILSFDNLEFKIKEELANSGLSEEEFLSAVKKFSKSTFKAALNNPELYINYTQDALYRSFQAGLISGSKDFPDKKAEARAYMIYFFQNNIAKIMKALQYVDTDTLNQMMDKRSTSFSVMLRSLEKLTPENGEILKELISHTKEGDAKQKIKLCELASIFQTNNFDMNLLKNLNNNLNDDGIINTNSMNDMFKSALVKKAGLECETEKTNTAFNEEFIHLLFSDNPSLNNGYRSWNDDFQNFLKAAVSGEFEGYITDETNKYGRANKNTEEKFKQYGLDYEKWFHPDFKQQSFDLKGKNMSVKIWDRNPYEDIFLGNKTRCCTAIATGSNSAAMPIFMMNTAFNVIEVEDDKNNVKGMARIYMSVIDDKPSVVIDSIELSDIRQMDKEEKTAFANIIFQYAKEFGETISKEPVKVYYVTEDSHLSIGDKYDKFEMKPNEFIGDISSDKVYSNRNSSSKWDDLREKIHTNFYVPF